MVAVFYSNRLQVRKGITQAGNIQSSRTNATSRITALNLPETTQAKIIASEEGWLAPAEILFISPLRVREIERGQATLPDCIYPR
jgi:hypothetical protein